MFRSLVSCIGFRYSVTRDVNYVSIFGAPGADYKTCPSGILLPRICRRLRDFLSWSTKYSNESPELCWR